jgi:hypothetical protein
MLLLSRIDQKGPALTSPLYAIVEIPKGSRNKYEWDARMGAIKLDRLLFTSVAYPTDYGYFPETLAEDGDPLDVMVCVSEPTFSGCYIQVKVIALFRMSDEKGWTTRSSVSRVRIPTGATWSGSRTCRSSCATRSRTFSRSTSSLKDMRSRSRAGARARTPSP